MFKNYIKIAWRNLIKNKWYTIINVSGLAVGVLCFVLISLYVRNEFSFDRFHARSDRIYRVWQHEKYGPKEDFVNVMTPVSMVHELKSTFPEIEDGTRVYRFNSLVRRQEDRFNEPVVAVDPGFFKIFDFELVKGNTRDPFGDPNAIILSESAAGKYFGSSDPIGRTMELTLNDGVHPFTVTGVVRDPPGESSIRFDLLVSLENESLFFNEDVRRSWFNVVLESYILLQEPQTPSGLEAKFPRMIRQYLGDEYRENTFFLHLQPLTEIHLDTSLPQGLEPISSPKYSYVMATIALVVLLLACINFITLAMGRSFSRATEVGVRKALGANKRQLVYQFWGEALLTTLFAVMAGVFLALIALPVFNRLTGKSLDLTWDADFFLTAFFLVVFIAMVAGIYPSLILSRFNPMEVLRKKQGTGVKMGWLGKGLVVAQFVSALVLIICTLVINSQLKFLVSKDLGYQKEAIVVVPTHKDGEEAASMAGLYTEKLKQSPLVTGVTTSMYSLAENSWLGIGFTDNQNRYRDFSYNEIDPQFLKTYHIPLVAGRDFEIGNASDADNGVLVNESFVKEFGLEDPVGKIYDKFGVTIIGVVADFNYESLLHPIKPLMLGMNTNAILREAENVQANFVPQPRVSVRLQAGTTERGIGVLRNAWERLRPGQAFEYNFLDQTLEDQYQNERRSRAIVNNASLLAIFIACMGLFGLATLNVARRRSEIGIRKVLGASAVSIIGMISLDFVRLVLVATLMAFPIAWWAMHVWLQDFAYGIALSWWMFAGAAALVLVITLFTTGLQTVRASLMNPVTSLRTE